MSSLLTKYCFSLIASLITSHRDVNKILSMEVQDLLNATTYQQTLKQSVFIGTFGVMVVYDIVKFIKGEIHVIQTKNIQNNTKKFTIHEINLLHYLSNTVPIVSFALGNLMAEEQVLESIMGLCLKAGFIFETVADGCDWNPKIIIANEINSSHSFTITTDWMP